MTVISKVLVGLVALAHIYFLAGGVIWSLLISAQDWQRNVALYFLICVLAAGLYGALILPTTLYVQAIPAALAIVSMFAFRKAA